MTPLTSRVNYAFSGRGLLMLDYEWWFLLRLLANADVWGAKFALTF